MSRTLVVGDMHCKQKIILPYVEEYVNLNTDVDNVVLLGDYVDDYNVTDKFMLEQLQYHVEWYNRVRSNVNVVNLCGNHDWCYLVTDNVVASGHRYAIESGVRDLLCELNVTMSCVVGQFIVTHAGLTREWTDSCEEFKDVNVNRVCDVLNTMFANKDARLNKCGSSRGGKGCSGPLWADASELYDSPYNQIVGHTPVSTPTILRGLPHSPKNNAVLLCDTLSSSSSGTPWGNGHLVLVDDNSQITTTSIPNWKDMVKHYQDSVMMSVIDVFVDSYSTVDKLLGDVTL